MNAFRESLAVIIMVNGILMIIIQVAANVEIGMFLYAMQFMKYFFQLHVPNVEGAL